MLAVTRANLGQPMAVVYIEKRSEVSEVDGKKVTRYVTDEKVINDATIQGVFGNAFRISGMTAGESRDLSLLLRAGSLSVPIYPIDERTIGPSLGKENIQRGRRCPVDRHGRGIRVHVPSTTGCLAWWPTPCCWRMWCC